MKQLKKIVYLVVFSGLLWSCGSSKPAYSKAPSKPSSSKKEAITVKLISEILPPQHIASLHLKLKK